MKNLFLIFSLLGTLSCARNSAEKDKSILNLALTSNVSTLDPAVSYDTVSSRVINQISESLFEYNYLIRPYQLQPLLANSLPLIEEGGTKYTFKIKKGIFFHEHSAFKGKKKELKAIHFINALKRLAYQPTKSNGWWLFNDKIVGLDEFHNKTKKSPYAVIYQKKIKGLYTTSDYSFVIKLKQRYPQLISAMAMAFTSPVTQEIIDFYKNDLSSFIVGTGPYKLIEWQRTAKIKLEKNKSYHHSTYPKTGDRFANLNKLLADAGKNIPFIKKITFHIMKEAQTRWLQFNAKNIDIITLTKDHFPLALDVNGNINQNLSKNNIQLQIAPTLTYWWLSFNMKDELLGKNTKLRQAFAHAINIDRYINDFTNNIALKANSIYPPGVPGYTPTNKLPYSYDVEMAKKLLKEAGYPEGKGLPVFNYDVRGASTVSRQMGEYIQKELAVVGIKIDIIINSFPGFLKKARTSQLQIWQGGWAMDYPDPENVIQLLTTKNHAPGPNASLYSNKKVDVLYKKLAAAKTQEEVFKITNAVEKIIGAEVPWAMQYYSRNYILNHGRLKNLRESDLINNNLKYLRLE